jgi:dimethylargininase
MVKNEGDRPKRVVVCLPETENFNIESVAEHNILEVADKATAIKQYEKLLKTIENFGTEVIDIKEMPDHPNSVFTQDIAVSTPDGYIKVRMGIGTRRGEEDWMARYLDEIGEPCAGEIKEPGTVEGGDVMISGSVAFVGLTQRTNVDGVIQISDILKKMEY